MSLINLAERFEKMFDDGYAEEDILDAFIDSLESERVKEDDEESASILEKRIEDLRLLSKVWVEQNLL